MDVWEEYNMYKQHQLIIEFTLSNHSHYSLPFSILLFALLYLLLSSEDVGQKWKLIANAQQVSSQTIVFIPIYYHNMTHKTVSN